MSVTKPTASAPLANMALALRAMNDCMDGKDSSTRFSVFYGPAGYGKTTGAIFAGMRTQAARIVAKSVWDKRAVLEALADELGIAHRPYHIPKLFDVVALAINAHPRPIIVDEMDYLVKKEMVDLIRDIHEATNVGIMLVGMEQLPGRLREWEQFHSRIRRVTPAQPASAEDALLLRDHYCLDVEIADDLAIYFATACAGVTRRIVSNLREAQDIGNEQGLPRIDREWWADRPVSTGDLPTRRAAA